MKEHEQRRERLDKEWERFAKLCQLEFRKELVTSDLELSQLISSRDQLVEICVMLAASEVSERWLRDQRKKLDKVVEETVAKFSRESPGK